MTLLHRLASLVRWFVGRRQAEAGLCILRPGDGMVTRITPTLQPPGPATREGFCHRPFSGGPSVPARRRRRR